MNYLRSFALAAGLSLAFGSAFAQDSAAPEPERNFSDVAPGLERPGDHVLGEADAPLLVVEYASVVCPHCAHFHESVYPMIHDEFIATGQVRFVMREMITSPPQLGFAGYMLAACSGESRWFDTVDLLFAEQQAIFEAAQSPDGALPVYERIAGAVGVSPEAFQACLGDESVYRAIETAHLQAAEDGVASTPSFFIGGRMLGAESGVYNWGGEPLLIEGETVPARVDQDTFRRIILHFLSAAESE